MYPPSWRHYGIFEIEQASLSTFNPEKIYVYGVKNLPLWFGELSYIPTNPWEELREEQAASNYPEAAAAAAEKGSKQGPGFSRISSSNIPKSQGLNNNHKATRTAAKVDATLE